jgi:hypothetical protein
VSPPQAAGKNQYKDKRPSPPLAVRWSEDHPGCTFSRSDDGKYRYGLWSGDVAAILAVDARELQIIAHRNWPFFGVFLTIRYRGAGSLDTSSEGITMQFMKHFKVVQTSLDPKPGSKTRCAWLGARVRLLAASPRRAARPVL